MRTGAFKIKFTAFIPFKPLQNFCCQIQVAKRLAFGDFILCVAYANFPSNFWHAHFTSWSSPVRAYIVYLMYM